MNTRPAAVFLLVLWCAGLLTGCGLGPSAEDPVPSISAPPSEPESRVITFADPVVEAETRRILSKPSGDITEADVLTITEFGRWSTQLVDRDISTLLDLRCFKIWNT